MFHHNFLVFPPIKAGGSLIQMISFFEYDIRVTFLKQNFFKSPVLPSPVNFAFTCFPDVVVERLHTLPVDLAGYEASCSAPPPRSRKFLLPLSISVSNHKCNNKVSVQFQIKLWADITATF
jgi:hypothetical protein